MAVFPSLAAAESPAQRMTTTKPEMLVHLSHSAYSRILTRLFQAVLDPKTSRRIFELARDQQEEFDEKELDDEDETPDQHPLSIPRQAAEEEDDFDFDRYEDDDAEEIEEIVSKAPPRITQTDDEQARKLMRMT